MAYSSFRNRRRIQSTTEPAVDGKPYITPDTPPLSTMSTGPPFKSPEDFWAKMNRLKQTGWMNYGDWRATLGRNLPPYARQRGYQDFLAALPRPIRPAEPIIPPRPPDSPGTVPPPLKSAPAGNQDKPISITYKFSDPALQAKAEQIRLSPPQAKTSTANRPLINPLPQATTSMKSPPQTPAPTDIGYGRFSRDWRRGFQSNRQPLNQGGFMNWLTNSKSQIPSPKPLGLGSRGWGLGGGYGGY